MAPNRWTALIAFIITVPLSFFLEAQFPDMNYFVRNMYVILLGFTVLYSGGIASLFSRTAPASLRFRSNLFQSADRQITWFGLALLVLLILLHIVFH